MNIYNCKCGEESNTYIPKSWKPFPGQKKCTAAPYPSGKGTKNKRLKFE